jgi:hypothetical protein
MPLFEADLAPRFCFAREILVATIDEGRVISRQRLVVESLAWPERIRRLEELGVSVVLASGFDRYQLPMAVAHGLQVISGLGGNAEALLQAFCAGEVGREDTAPPAPPGQRRRRRGSAR